VICGLGGGGSEQWLRDIVRLSPDDVDHEVVTVYGEGRIDFVHATDLRALAAYDGTSMRRQVATRATRAVLPYARALRPGRRSALGSLARGAAWAPALARALSVGRRFVPQVLHSHTAPDYVVGLGLSRLLGAPLVHTVPSLFSQMRAAGYGWIPALYARTHQRVARFSTGENRGELEAVGVPPERIFYDLGGVDLAAADRAGADRGAHRAHLRRRLGVAPDCPIAITIGRLDVTKGHARALEALPGLVRGIPDVHWVVLGAGDEQRALEARAIELGVRSRVHFLGFVTDPLTYAAACDVYFHTALLEPENLSLYQALAMGLPVVSIDTGERGSLEGVGHGIQVRAGDTAGFAAAAAMLLEMPDRGRSLGARGAAHARRHLDLEDNVGRLCSLYRELACASRA
jgi:glycosyltransferase involved in cell wall biosynthesis